jgi:DnaJ-class molecular chaperone
MTTFDDPHDFCRVCRGRGFVQSWEWNIHANTETLQNFTCNQCQGSGMRTLRLLPKGEGK